MEKHALGILGIVVAVAIAGMFSMQDGATGMAARKIIVHHGMQMSELQEQADGRVTPALLKQYGIKIIDENIVATPRKKPVGILVDMPNKHQSKNGMLS